MADIRHLGFLTKRTTSQMSTSQQEKANSVSFHYMSIGSSTTEIAQHLYGAIWKAKSFSKSDKNFCHQVILKDCMDIRCVCKDLTSSIFIVNKPKCIHMNFKLLCTSVSFSRCLEPCKHKPRYEAENFREPFIYFVLKAKTQPYLAWNSLRWSCKDISTIKLSICTNMMYCYPGAALGCPHGNQQERLSPEVQELADMYWAWRLSDMPEFASFVGIHDYDDRLDELSLGAWQDRLNKCEQLLGQATELLPSLTDRYDLLNVNILINELQTYIEGYPLMGFTLPLNYMEGIHADLERLVSWMKLEDLKDYEKLMARYQSIPNQISDINTLMETGVSMGIVNHGISMKGVGAALGRFVVSSAEDSPLWTPFVNLTGVISPEEADYLRVEATDIIINYVSPAFAELQRYVQEDYVTRPDIGITSIPTGPEMYDQLLRFHTSTDLTADQIHKIGLDEVDRIEAEMAKIVSELGYNLTVPEFSAMIKNDSQFFYDSPEALMAGFEDIVYNRIQPQLPLAFINIPEAKLDKYIKGAKDGGPVVQNEQSANRFKPGFKIIIDFFGVTSHCALVMATTLCWAMKRINVEEHFQTKRKYVKRNTIFFKGELNPKNNYIVLS
ncbi:unnamed protein product, partial [Meganyctiphanes norvegica]